MMTKLFKDPCAIINSSFYRYGDENMGKVSNLEADTVARVSKGTFEFIGILERFLNRVQKDRCFWCTGEECALIRLVQTRRQEKEMKEQDQEETEEIKKTHKLTKLQKWGLGIKRKFQIGMGRCLIDQNYTCMTKLILSKAEYKKAVAKHFLLAQLFRFLGWTCMLDLANPKKKILHSEDTTLAILCGCLYLLAY